MIIPGSARVTHLAARPGEPEVLTCEGLNVVVELLGTKAIWTLIPVNEEQFILAYGGLEEMTKMVATLDPRVNSDESINVVATPRQDPPAQEQLWTMRDGIMLPMNPPILQGRIESCAKPLMSMAVGGIEPLPKTMLNVCCVPTDSVQKETLMWKIQYLMGDE